MISIIVPVYKSEKTLERCVNSLLSQTDKDFEILLIVDGPPDNSGVLCEKLAKRDARIRVINQANQGVSKARNHGISEAKGKYIRFVDSDDFIDKDSNEILLKAMKETDADLVIAGFHHLYFGRDIVKLPKTACFRMEKLSESQQRDFLELYKKGFLNMPWNKLYKKELIQEGFPTELNLGEDLLFNQAYILKSRTITVVTAPVCNYVQDDRGTTLSTKKRMDKIPIAMRLYRESTAFFRKLSMDDGNMPATKAVMEFLDDMEGLAFEKHMKKAEKLEVIRIYEDALQNLNISGKKLSLDLPDYRILYFFSKRNAVNTVYDLICIRGILVKLLKKR